MKDEARPDYRRVKDAALQALATGGDAEATKELARRGIAVVPVANIETMTEADLHRLVHAWRDGRMPADRERNSKLAVRAQAELEARYRTDIKLRKTWSAEPLPQPPSTPPWRWPKPSRCEPWQRPDGSTLYPSPAEEEAARFRAMAVRLGLV
jgi:hypothetical protein